MSDKRHVARVNIVGEEYTVRSDAPADHTIAVAAYLDREIRKVLGANALIEPHKAAILAAMSITDDLLRERTTASLVEEEIRGLGNEIRRWLPPAKRGDGATGES